MSAVDKLWMTVAGVVIAVTVLMVMELVASVLLPLLLWRQL